ncbi:MAG: hypothetical protein ACREDR_13195, partial [Blastocatellia bacterium]
IEGGHLPSKIGGERSIVPALPAWAEAGLKRTARAVAKACDVYQARSDTQEAIQILAETRRQELIDLESLYGRKHGAIDRLYGLPTPDTGGSASIEAELRRLQNIVLDRYRVRVRLRMLSLGLFEGNVPHEACK